MTIRLGYNRWTALAAISVMLFIGMALPIYGASVVNTYMVVDRGWDRQSLGLLVGVNFLTVAALSPVAAALVRTLGARTTMAIGCLIMVLSSATLPTLVEHPWQAIAAFSVGFGVAGSLIGIIPCQTAVAGWFVEKRTLALSILYAVMGLGGFAAAWVANLLIVASGDWRIGWWCIGAVAAAGIPISIFLVRETRADGPGAMPPSLSQGDDTTAGGIHEALRSPFLWAIYFAMLSGNAASSFMVSHGQIFLRGIGFSGTDAATAISLFSAATVAGNLGFALLTQRLDIHKALAITLIPLGLAFGAFAHVAGISGLVLVVALLGAAFGGCQVGVMAALGHYWRTSAFPFLTALGLIIQTIGGTLLPISAGRYYDAFGDYAPVIWAIAGVCLVAAAALSASKTRRSTGTARKSAPPLGRPAYPVDHRNRARR